MNTWQNKKCWSKTKICLKKKKDNDFEKYLSLYSVAVLKIPSL